MIIRGQNLAITWQCDDVYWGGGPRGSRADPHVREGKDLANIVIACLARMHAPRHHCPRLASPYSRHTAQCRRSPVSGNPQACHPWYALTTSLAYVLALPVYVPTQRFPSTHLASTTSIHEASSSRISFGKVKRIHPSPINPSILLKYHNFQKTKPIYSVLPKWNDLPLDMMKTHSRYFPPSKKSKQPMEGWVAS